MFMPHLAPIYWCIMYLIFFLLISLMFAKLNLNTKIIKIKSMDFVSFLEKKLL